MNIKQASEQSGVSAPNIRFYEKEGLLTPARRQGNDYRDYTAGDVRTLKLIRMLRMLDVPLPTIKAVLRGEQPLQQALQAQQTVLEQQAAQLAAAMQFCAKTRRPFQLLCALLQCGLLLPQNTPQRCIARQNGPDDRKRHIQHSQHPDEPEGADILFCVVAVIVASQSGRVQKSLFFIESDIGGGHPALFRSLFDVH